jgi:hypothetical protein
MLSEILSIAVGVFFVYLLLSLICSTVVEWLSKVLGFRAKMLEKWIRRLLHDSVGANLTEKIYNHPLIEVLTPEGRANKPSHIPPKLFAIALIEVVVGRERVRGLSTTGQLREAIAASDCPEDTREALESVVGEEDERIDSAYASIGRWFDDPMDMLSRAYKNKVSQIVFFVALGVTLLLNLDTLMISSTLWEHCDLRAKVEMAATAFVQNRETDAAEDQADRLDTLLLAALELSDLEIPLGWSGDPEDPRSFPQDFQGRLKKLLGLLATVLAASLGAPFWFDMLHRLIGLRQGRMGAGQGQETGWAT